MRAKQIQISYRRNGMTERARSMSHAMYLVHSMLGADRVYRGAEYQTDREADNRDERENCTGLDIWLRRSNANKETAMMADAVISWR